MSLLALILTLIVVGVLVWLLNTYGGPYIAQPYLQIINILIIVVVVIWLLKALGLWAYLANIRI